MYLPLSDDSFLLRTDKTNKIQYCHPSMFINTGLHTTTLTLQCRCE